MTLNTLKPLFAKLRKGLVPMVEVIKAQEESDDSVLKQGFS